MIFTPTPLPGVIEIEPDVYCDDRGFMMESYQRLKYEAGGVRGIFVQDNHSLSVKGTVRGLHFQFKKPQGKLIRAIRGKIFDVAVDIRRSSPTFKQWYGTELSAENFRQLYVPPNFAHGILVLSEGAEVEYKCTEYYDPADEGAIFWNEPQIGIPWPVKEPILSAKDQAAPRLSEILDKLPTYRP